MLASLALNWNERSEVLIEKSLNLKISYGPLFKRNFLTYGGEGQLDLPGKTGLIFCMEKSKVVPKNQNGRKTSCFNRLTTLYFYWDNKGVKFLTSNIIRL